MEVDWPDFKTMSLGPDRIIVRDITSRTADPWLFPYSLTARQTYSPSSLPATPIISRTAVVLFPVLDKRRPEYSSIRCLKTIEGAGIPRTKDRPYKRAKFMFMYILIPHANNVHFTLNSHILTRLIFKVSFCYNKTPMPYIFPSVGTNFYPLSLSMLMFLLQYTLG